MAAVLHNLDQRRLIDSNGIADGASIYFYTTGTLTPAAVYTTASLSVAHPSPIVVAGGAAVPDIYLDSAVTYRRRIVYGDGTVDDTDPYIAPFNELTGSFLLPYQYGVAGDYSFTADTGTDDATALQAMATDVDTGAVPGLQLALGTGADYLVTSPIILEKAGGGLVGTKLPSYTRGQKKAGNFVIDAAAAYAINLPYDGLWTDAANQADPDYVFADSWTFKNIGFRQRTGADPKSKVGIWYDMQNNGPHRHMLLDQVSGSGLRSVFEVAPKRTGVTTTLANLIVQNSVLSNNRYGVYASGPVYCVRFVGNQAEQNNAGVVTGADEWDGGAIHGNFAGAITITDNMLEGQPNAINIEPEAARINALVARNYLETNNVNNSQYVGRFATNQGFLNNTLTWGPNFFSGNNFPTDFLRIEGTGNWVLNMNDPYPVVFKNWAGSLLRGSNIFPRGVQKFGIKGINTAVKQPEMYLGDNFARQDTGVSWTHQTFTSPTEMDSPYGKVFAHDANTAVPLGFGCTAGDLIVVTALVLIQDKDPAGTLKHQLTTGAGAFLASLGDSYADVISGGDWAVISYPIIAPSTQASLGFKYGMTSGTVNARIAGLCARNYGAYTNDGTVRQDITPVMPRVQLAGPRIIAQSAAAVSHTGDTAVTDLATVTVPGKAMGPNGRIEVREQWSYTNSANAKTLTLVFGGTAFRNTAPTTTASLERKSSITNRNSLSSQLGPVSGQAPPNQATTVTPVTGANNTANDTDVKFRAQLANAGETITLEGYEVILWPKG